VANRRQCQNSLPAGVRVDCQISNMATRIRPNPTHQYWENACAIANTTCVGHGSACPRSSNIITNFGTTTGKLFWHCLRFATPILGSWWHKTATARFALVLGTLLQSGVDVLRALEITQQTLQSPLYNAALSQVSSDVKGGMALSSALASHNVFDDLTEQLVAVGEESGRLVDMLLKLADVYGEEAELQTNRMVAALEPVTILAMGIFVGAIVISMLLPVLSINLTQ